MKVPDYFLSDVAWRVELSTLKNYWAARLLAEIRSLDEIVLPRHLA